MVEHFDLVRLAELRDAHGVKVDAYRRSTEQVRDAAQAATRARMEAPALPGSAPAMPRHVFAPGIGHAAKPRPIRAMTNDFYLLPLATLREFTPAQLTPANIDHRAFARIVAAETRLERLRAEQSKNAASVRESAGLMRGVELCATENRL